MPKYSEPNKKNSHDQRFHRRDACEVTGVRGLVRQDACWLVFVLESYGLGFWYLKGTLRSAYMVFARGLRDRVENIFALLRVTFSRVTASRNGIT